MGIYVDFAYKNRTVVTFITTTVCFFLSVLRCPKERRPKGRKRVRGRNKRIQTEMPSEALAYRARATAGKAKRETNYSVEVLAFRFDLSPEL